MRRLLDGSRRGGGGLGGVRRQPGLLIVLQSRLKSLVRSYVVAAMTKRMDLGVSFPETAVLWGHPVCRLAVVCICSVLRVSRGCLPSPGVCQVRAELCLYAARCSLHRRLMSTSVFSPGWG